MNTRIALERFWRWEEARSSSIWRIRAATDTPSAMAISRNTSQNSGSKETLVACPAITTDRFMMCGADKFKYISNSCPVWMPFKLTLRLLYIEPTIVVQG